MGNTGPIINRSDGRLYHVNMFAGPEPRARADGTVYAGQGVCYFTYANMVWGPRVAGTAVIILDTTDLEQKLRQIEEAADQLAIWIEGREKPLTIYTFTRGLIVPGFPK